MSIAIHQPRKIDKTNQDLTHAVYMLIIINVIGVTAIVQLVTGG